MNMQLHEAFGIVEARAHSDQDLALLRDLQLVRGSDRKARRARRRRAR
jgi:hypothetical protein